MIAKSRQSSFLMPVKQFLGYSARLLALCACFLMITISARAQQTGQGTLSGVVSDSTGAILVGAHVSITNVSTNFTDERITNQTGYYEDSSLIPGTYRVMVSNPGFQNLNREGITVEAAAHVNLPLTLNPGSTSATITVSADASLLETDAVSSGQELTTKQVESLPVGGSNTTYFAMMAPGAQTNISMATNPTDTVGNNTLGAFFGAFGQINNSDYSLDGAPNMGNTRYTAVNVPSDALGHAKYDVSGFDASVGHTMGMSITQTTKSGTNDIHGTVRDTYGAKRWAGMSHFQGETYRYQEALNNCVNGPATSPTCYGLENKYGWPGAFVNYMVGTVGGPVFIPKIYDGHNKFFFFLSFLNTHSTSVTSATASVPTLLERTGDFSDMPTTTTSIPSTYTAACGTANYYGQYQIYDPFSVAYDSKGIPRRKPLCGNVIPSNRLQSNSLQTVYNSLLPTPTSASSTGSNDVYSSSVALTFRDFTTREDFKINDSNSLFARYTHAHYSNITSGFTANNTDRNSGPRWVQVGAVGWSRLLNNSTTLDLVAGASNFKTACCFYPGYDAYTPSSLGLPSYTDGYAKGSGAIGVELPIISVGGYSQIGKTDNSSATYRVFSFRGTLTHVAGSHTIRAGGEYRLQNSAAGAQGNVSGTYAFDNSYDQQNNGTDATYATSTWGLSYADLMMGIPTSASVGYTSPYSVQNPYYAFYVADTWRITPKLTIIPGLRYEYEYGVAEKHNQIQTGWNLNADMSAISAPANVAYASALASATAAQRAVLPTSLSIQGGVQYAAVNGAPRNEWNNNYRFLPRIALAYQINSKTVAQIGYGLYFDTMNALTPTLNQGGFSTSTASTSSTTYGLNFTAGTSPLMTDPFPANSSGVRFNAPIGAAAGQYYSVGTSPTVYDHGMIPARMHRISIGIQRQLGASSKIEVTYSGALTNNLSYADTLKYAPSSLYTGGNQPNTAINTLLGTQVKNPFQLANFSSMSSSNSAEYGMMALNSYFTQSQVTLASLVKTYPHMNGLTMYRSIAQSHFQQLLITYTRRYSNGLSIMATGQYNVQNDRDYRANAFDPYLSWEPSNNSRPLRVTIQGVWDLPFGRGKKWANSGLASKLLGGFRLDGTYEAQNGLLVNFGNLFYVGDVNANAIKLRHPVYVNNLANGGSLYVKWLNPGNVVATTSTNSGVTTCTYSGTGFVTNSSCQPNSYNLRTFPTRVSGVRQMGLSNFNANIARTFKISKRVNFETTMNVYNLFNHQTLGAPNVTPTSNQFGWVTSDNTSNGALGRMTTIQGRLRF